MYLSIAWFSLYMTILIFILFRNASRGNKILFSDIFKAKEFYHTWTSNFEIENNSKNIMEKLINFIIIIIIIIKKYIFSCYSHKMLNIGLWKHKILRCNSKLTPS